ncbi:hypothetical protein [Microcella indica]|uniref:hypothetical protein n=1 Tax=Microcella indica TaxID=2750620 RepID=UPI0015CF106B|nr:hypothetical protein [Microcella indica]
MPALLVTAIVVSLERHRRLTPVTAILTGLSTLAIVGGAILVTFSATAPALASDFAPRGVGESSLERVDALQLPTL